MCEQSDEDDTTTTATATASSGDTNTDPPDTLTPCPRCQTPVTTVSAIGPTDAIAGPCGCRVAPGLLARKREERRNRGKRRERRRKQGRHDQQDQHNQNHRHDQRD
ncbi:hypothetical protein C483_15342 [Natrialba hulunbeirensis JCM 10989]|uniref:Small CPxCG-related zinc finger protein n=1 Tax=Natrialba hulunbeirensis JCM 10989 TaxID=1227493 RepID=L9ZT47_9EURY|nr:hypothetical protein [Natrialba hulunbeirensis]ELY88722.1 hypothetical protein C483_15342 [Natrialba hulunbeirensis JCM 10989]